jgi:PIN domain nuclease of toxin-antitoxin system
VNILLDSHALLWALHDPGRLRPAAARTISEPGVSVFYSAASVWELELKVSRGKLRLPDEWLVAAERAGFLHLPITAGEARSSARLPWHHTDPFDRILVAQAREQVMKIATRDPLILQYGVPVLQV